MAKPTRKRTRSAPGAQIKGLDALANITKEANKKFGQGTVQMGKEVQRFNKLIPFGHFIGDLATLGGLPEGQASMLIGKEGGGKTTQAMRLAAQAQKKYPNKIVIWVDSERTFDPVWAESHGVDMERMHIIETVAGEDAVDIMQRMKEDIEGLAMIVVDSVPAMVPLKEYSESVGDHQVALQARLIGRMCSHLNAASTTRRNKGFEPVTEVFINQWRTAIGSMARVPRSKPGGHQFAYFCSTHIDFKAMKKSERDGDDMNTPYVVEHVFNMLRDKLPSSLKSGEYSVVVGADHRLPIGSYDEAGTILTHAKKFGLYNGAGQRQQFTMYDETFRKMDEAKEWLEDNPDAALEIKRAMIMYRRERVGMKALPPDGYLLRHK